MKRIHLALFLVLIMAGSVQAGSPGWQPGVLHQVGWTAADNTELDVPYVPTPETVVAEMLDMAEVGPGDLVYDLGCGDGRIVIMAAKERGARGLGFDLDPERIAEARANAAAAKVTDRVSFRQQDLFTVDLRKATVLTLYLLPEVNLRLRPKILHELRPGTRLVSHSFDMDDWEPDQAVTVNGSAIFFWTVPANVTGTWEWEGEEGKVLHLTQRFQEVGGTITAGGEELPLAEVVLEGDRLEFAVEEMVNGRPTTMRYAGVVNGDAIAGTSWPADGAGEEEQWTARHDPATATALDNGGEAVGL